MCHIPIRWFSMGRDYSIVVKFYYHIIMKIHVPFTYWFFNIVKVSI